MDSPITIFSSEPSKSEEVINLSETSRSTFMRVPASWESGRRSLKRTNSNRSLSHIQKVTNWIKSINKTEKASINIDNKTGSPTVGIKYASERKDFKNPLDCDIPEQVITRQSSNEVFDCSSLCSYLQKCEKEDNDFNLSNSSLLTKGSTRKSKSSYKTPLLAPPKVDATDKNSVKVDISDSSSVPAPTEVPLSPESQKKELCSYLQLMNPADKKQVLILQNRRSMRVKNLSFLFDKKVQETKEATDHKETKDKSKREHENTISKSKFSQKQFIFHFPSLPKKFKQNIDDFDHIMRTKIRLYSIDKEKGEKQVHKLNGEIKLATNNHNEIQINKENIKNVEKKTLVTEHPKLPMGRKTTNLTIKRKLRNNSQVPKKNLEKVVDIERVNSLRNRNFTDPSNTDEKKLDVTKHVTKIKVCEKTKEPITRNEPIQIRPKSAPVLSDYIITDPIDTSRESNFITDISDLDFLSEEHKKCILETRMLSNSGSDRSSLAQLSPLCGFKTDEVELNTNINIEEKQSELECLPVVVEHKEEKEQLSDMEPVKEPVGELEEVLPKENKTEITKPKNSLELLTQIENQFSTAQFPVDYSIFDTSFAEMNVDSDVTYISNETLEDISTVENPKCTPFDDKVETKSLHRSLNSTKRKSKNSIENDTSITHAWAPYNSPSQKQKRNQHYITVAKENGSILKAFYIDYNLIICQECLVSFWTQTALGNVLGAQNMWIQKGQAQRLVLNTKCLQKDSSEMVVATDTNVAYIELWMKEHKSELRELPVADVFATVYFWKQRQNGLDRKVLQLENINGFSDDVQYLVLRWAPKIVVSWHSATNNELETNKTYIHCYELAADYQTVANISEIQAVEHYVSSLHIIEDCEELIMGCGENKITLWNVVYGYTVATIELTEMRSPLSTLWVKCDRGFLFTLQQCVDRELRLIAINGINHKWKKLASYFPPEGYDRLKGVCIENGIVLSFYDQGMLCWNAQTGEPVVEETQIECDYIVSGNYVIIIGNDQINVKHAVTYLISPEDT